MTPDLTCPNCQTVRIGRYCHQCGQDGYDPVVNFRLLASEAVDSVLGWDSRLGRSLRLLYGQPGALSEEFVAGRRARYLGPVRLYIIASLLFFACYTLVPDPVIATITGLGDPHAGLARTALIERWLPSLMILIWPALAAALGLLFRGAGRPFLATQVLVLHFGTIAFLNMPAGHLLAFGLVALGAGKLSVIPIYLAHGLNVVYLYGMLRRFYGEPPWTTVSKLLVYAMIMTLVLGGTAAGMAALVGG